MKKYMEEELSGSIGRKILVMTEYYPFFFVGILKKVRNEQIWVDVRFGVSAPLKNSVFEIRLDAISAFYAEDKNNKIPDVW